jgi:hypothetical protein
MENIVLSFKELEQWKNPTLCKVGFFIFYK